MQVGVHQRGNLLAAGTHAARVVVVVVLAAQVLQVGQSQLEGAVGGRPQYQLGMADAPAVDDFSQPVYHISLSYNIFKLHILLFKLANIQIKT